MARQKKLEKISSPPRRLINFSRTKKKLFDSATSIWVHDKMLVGVMVFAESCRYHEYVPKRFDMTHIVRRYKSSCWKSISSSGNENIENLLKYAEEASVLCDAKVGAIVFLNSVEVVHFPPESSRLMQIFDRWERLNEEQSTPGPLKSRFSEKSPTSTSPSKSNIAKLEALNTSLEESLKKELHEKSLAIQSLQKESHLEIQNMQSELKVYNMTLQQINTKLTDFVITKKTSYSSSSSSPTEEICVLKRQLAAAMENEKEVPFESGYPSKRFNPGSNNFADSYYYDVLQSHFDKLDIPTQTEYHIPWFQDFVKTPAISSMTSYPQLPSCQSQPNRADPSSTSTNLP